jgi:hypothetical protein
MYGNGKIVIFKNMMVLLERGPMINEIFVLIRECKHEDIGWIISSNSESLGMGMHKNVKIHYSERLFGDFLDILRKSNPR